MKQCQAKYGKKILLSIGGPGNSLPLGSDQAALSFANILWELFGPAAKIHPGMRPFGTAVLDGSYLSTLSPLYPTQPPDPFTPVRTHLRSYPNSRALHTSKTAARRTTTSSRPPCAVSSSLAPAGTTSCLPLRAVPTRTSRSTRAIWRSATLSCRASTTMTSVVLAAGFLDAVGDWYVLFSLLPFSPVQFILQIHR